MISQSRLAVFRQSLGLFTQSILSGMWILIEVGAKYYHNLMMMMNDTVGRLSIWRWPIPFFSRPPPDWCIVIIKDGQFHLQDHSVHWIREFSKKAACQTLLWCRSQKASLFHLNVFHLFPKIPDLFLPRKFQAAAFFWLRLRWRKHLNAALFSFS